ncbi:hypothetical protein ILUMI_23424 [Ignelater luminosus]|uniref:Polyglutamine-binding protein 1 n=1 Tax=Ignelater luminosus TaxID=2038154 RepID=A0A8K0CFC8_IGNLU|nr:hypothetical protein ILUMI_23424 [Ignelater luminosus]
MPLPSVLAAKLAKRGLFAPAIQKPLEKERKRDFRGVTGCPNKSNIYHECNFWCESHWKPASLPDAKYMRNVGKLIQKYPLPHHWTEVFDKGIKRYYYWDMETDIVSWLPPKHPKAVRSESAAKLREKRAKGILNEERVVYKIDEEKGDRKRNSKSSRRDRDRDRDSESSDKRHKYDDKEYNRKRPRRDDIDPMDPAAYSDIPVGTWSDGLESNKSGADSTASGALYQQRPYPAPGDILANNKSKTRRNVSFTAHAT